MSNKSYLEFIVVIALILLGITIFMEPSKTSIQDIYIEDNTGLDKVYTSNIKCHKDYYKEVTRDNRNNAVADVVFTLDTTEIDYEKLGYKTYNIGYSDIVMVMDGGVRKGLSKMGVNISTSSSYYKDSENIVDAVDLIEKYISGQSEDMWSKYKIYIPSIDSFDGKFTEYALKIWISKALGEELDAPEVEVKTKEFISKAEQVVSFEDRIDAELIPDDSIMIMPSYCYELGNFHDERLFNYTPEVSANIVLQAHIKINKQVKDTDKLINNILVYYLDNDSIHTMDKSVIFNELGTEYLYDSSGFKPGFRYNSNKTEA